MSITLRPATPADQAFLYQLYCSTRNKEVAAWGWNAAQQESFLKMQFTAQQRSYEAQFTQPDHRIILFDEHPIGRIHVVRTDRDILLTDIALLPEHRSAGIGTALITELLVEASQAGKPVRLHVIKTNRAARLYERLGFRTSGDNGIYLEMEWHPPA